MNKKLSSVVTLVTTQVAPSALESGTWVVGLADIEAHTGKLTSKVFNSEIPRSSKFLFSAGDILFGKLRPELQKCVVAPHHGVCSTDIIVMRPNCLDDTWYVSLMLRSDIITNQIKRRLVGASLPRVRPLDLLACEIPWPDSATRALNGTRAQTISEIREAIRDISATIAVIESRLQSPQ